MKPPPKPPDIDDLRELVEQWAAFAADLARDGYGFDLDNWLNDVDVRELILEALPMYGPDELAPLAGALDAADAAFRAATRLFDRCVWGRRAAGKEHWTAERNWWYFRTPLRSNTDLEDDLARLR